MRTHIAAAAVAAAAILTLTATACSSGDSGNGKNSAVPTPSAPLPTPSVDLSSIASAAGLPPVPDAIKKAVLLAALKAIDSSIADDPDKAVSDGRAQCAALSGGGDGSGHTAASRFGTGSHPLSDDQGKLINAALLATLCPKT